jgi:hypothetical protein
MSKPARAIALTFRRVEYSLLLPIVFALTWLEAAPADLKENLARALLCVALMVAGLAGADIIRLAFA